MITVNELIAFEYNFEKTLFSSKQRHYKLDSSKEQADFY